MKKNGKFKEKDEKQESKKKILNKQQKSFVDFPSQQLKMLKSRYVFPHFVLCSVMDTMLTITSKKKQGIVHKLCCTFDGEGKLIIIKNQLKKYEKSGKGQQKILIQCDTIHRRPQKLKKKS